MNPRLQTSSLLLILIVLASCGGGGGDGDDTPPAQSDVLYPNVVEVEVTANADGTYRFAVTLSSPYDTPERYADAWRVRGSDGTVYGVRELAHDHANEQPFIRSLDGVSIPEQISTVIVEGRDRISGWGGATVTVELPGRGE